MRHGRDQIAFGSTASFDFVQIYTGDALPDRRAVAGAGVGANELRAETRINDGRGLRVLVPASRSRALGRCGVLNAATAARNWRGCATTRTPKPMRALDREGRAPTTSSARALVGLLRGVLDFLGEEVVQHGAKDDDGGELPISSSRVATIVATMSGRA